MYKYQFWVGFSSNCTKPLPAISLVLKVHSSGSQKNSNAQILKNPNNNPENHWFFHETWRFFKGFEMTGTNGYLILIIKYPEYMLV